LGNSLLAAEKTTRAISSLHTSLATDERRNADAAALDVMIYAIFILVILEIILLIISVYSAVTGNYMAATYQLGLITFIEVLCLRSQVANVRRKIMDWTEDDVDEDYKEDE
jgi:hypothetical protein